MTTVNPKVFIKAIRRLKWCTVCCRAIDGRYKERDRQTPETEFFHQIMGKVTNSHPWWRYPDPGVRVIALQLAACVAKDALKPARKTKKKSRT